MNFCSHCGDKVVLTIPDNDDRPRFVCNSCKTIHYQNPNIVAGVLPYLRADSDDTQEVSTNSNDAHGRILLCQRAIQPRHGLWTLPAGFMENGETVEEAARRESREEANLELRHLQLYTVMSLPHINQVYMLFLGEIDTQHQQPFHQPGIESLDTRLYNEEEIPWKSIAFPVIHETLENYFADRKKNCFPVHNLAYQPSSQIHKLSNTNT